MKKLLALSTIFAMLFTTTAFASENSGIPKSVQKKVDQNVKESKHELEPIRAWETDLNGKVVEVAPKSNEFNLRIPPSDGYRYVFNRYSSNKNQKNYRYQDLGTYRLVNNTSSPVTATYTQQSTITTNWSVSANVSAEAKIGTSFLGEIKVNVGGSVDRSKTWAKGQTFSASYTVQPRRVVCLTNYQVGVYSSGVLQWGKYHPSGANVGVYWETANGTAISTSDVNIELTEDTPL